MNGNTSKLITKASIVLGIPKKSLVRAWKNSNARGKALYRRRWSQEIAAAENGQLVKLAKEKRRADRVSASEESLAGLEAGNAMLKKMEMVAARNEEIDREQNG